jgi:peptidoglycan/xylan/chitin deacetylase (PgdA/CDA1 family)
LEFVSWRVRAFDTFVHNPEVLRNRILKRIRPGDIVMLHDKGGPAGNVMLDVLPGLLDELKDRGFECVPV